LKRKGRRQGELAGREARRREGRKQGSKCSSAWRLRENVGVCRVLGKNPEARKDNFLGIGTRKRTRQRLPGKSRGAGGRRVDYEKGEEV